MVRGAPGQKDPLSSSEGVRSDEELVLALNAKSITPSMSAPSSSSVSSATPNFGKYHIMKISSECFSGVWMNTLWQRKGISISPTRILPNFNNTSIHYKRPAREPLLGLLGVIWKKSPFQSQQYWNNVSNTCKCDDSVVFWLVIRVSPPPPVLCLHLSILSSSPPPLCEIRLAHLSSNYQRFMFKLILRGGLLLSSSIIML